MSGESKDATSNGLDAGDQLTQPPITPPADAMGWIGLVFFVLAIAVAFVEWWNDLYVDAGVVLQKAQRESSAGR